MYTGPLRVFFIINVQVGFENLQDSGAVLKKRPEKRKPEEARWCVLDPENR